MGISEINIAQIKCTKIEEYKDEARVIAMKDAHRKAKILTDTVDNKTKKIKEKYSNKIKNTITYHHVYPDNIENSSSSKQMEYILENLNVKYKRYLVENNDYIAQYKKIAEAIKN